MILRRHLRQPCQSMHVRANQPWINRAPECGDAATGDLNRVQSGSGVSLDTRCWLGMRCRFKALGVEKGEPAAIVKTSLTKPEQFERSPANARPAWLLISRVSGRDGRDDTTGVPHESPSRSERCRRHPRVL